MMIVRTISIAAAGVICCVQIARAQMNPKEKIASAMKIIQENYVDSIGDEPLADAAIVGMIQILDPHSKYISREEARQMQEAMSGHFTGIGIQYLMDRDTVFVTEVKPDGPAEKAGIMAGDGIVGIGGKKLAGQGITNYDIMKMLRGEKGTTVALQVWRKASASTFTAQVTRDEIADKAVGSAYMIDANTGFISLRIFNQSTRKEMDEALQRLKKEGMKNLILDLQGNGGGLVQEAIGVADEFLQKDQMVFYKVGNDHGKDYYYTGGFGQFMEGRLVVMIDQGTASASEILSGALQDWDRAVLVGRRSFGKGVMQKGFSLADGSVLELTGARYYTPSGRSIQKPYHGSGYDDNVSTRMASGELLDGDRIHFPDSLAVKTLVAKRKVFGGGGIMPDCYVPIDTAAYNSWFQRLFASGLVTKAVFDYVNRHRAGLKQAYPGFSSFQHGFTVEDTVLADLEQKAIVEGLVLQGSERSQVMPLLAMEMKGLIAAQLFGSNEYYVRVANAGNASFIRALAVISDPKQYATYLGQRQQGKKS